MSGKTDESTSGRSGLFFPLSSRSVSYQTTIWFFSFLLLIQIGIFGAGTMINIHRLDTLWEETADINFNNVSCSLALAVSQQLDMSPDWSDSVPSRIRTKLITQRLNILDRVYLVRNDMVYQLFPELRMNIKLDDMSPMREIWYARLSASSGIRTSYRASDNKDVTAAVFPYPPDAEVQKIMIVVERDLVQSRNIRQIVRFLDVFLLMGLAGCFLVIIFYATRIVRPFRLLNDTLSREEQRMPTISTGEQHKDPVAKIIGIVESTLRTIRENESRLEDLNRQLDTEARRKEELEESLLSSVNSGILTVDKNRRITSVTTKIPGLLELWDQNIIGQTCDETFGSASLISTMLTECLKDRHVHRQQQWKWEPPGRPSKWLSVSTTLLKGEFGSIIGAGFIFRDITAWKVLEEQVREKEHLAALGEMTAGIAHEIRNPLAVIQGNVNLLQDEIEVPDQLESMSEIQKELVSLTAIIDDFLKFAKPTRLEIARVNFSKFVQEFIDDFQTQFADDIQIAYQPRPGIPEIHIDELLFRQILQNIFTNAVQATGDIRKIDVVLKSSVPLAGKEAGDPGLLLQVRDYGEGLDPDLSEEIFKPFVTTRPTGTGLGLAIVKKFVLLHNGFIEFTNPDGPGTEVNIMIPRRYDPNQTQRIHPGRLDEG